MTTTDDDNGRRRMMTTTVMTTTTTPFKSFLHHEEGLHFLLIDHPAHPIGGGGSNQRELLASPCSPSPCALLATLLLPVGRAGEAQRQGIDAAPHPHGLPAKVG